MPTLQEIANELLEDLETDQVGLAKLAGVTEQAVSAWFRGKTKRMDAEAAFSLQHKTGWCAEYLMLGTGPKKLAQVRDQQVDYVVKKRISEGQLLDLSDLTDGNKRIIRRTVDALAESLTEQNLGG